MVDDYLSQKCRSSEASAQQVCKESRSIVHAHLFVVQRQAVKNAAQHLFPTGHHRRCSSLWRNSASMGMQSQEEVDLQKGHICPSVIQARHARKGSTISGALQSQD